MEKRFRVARKARRRVHRLMKFFNKNKEQDLIYLEISNRYNLAYWIAADLDHYVENKSNISPHEYYKLILQYKLAVDIFEHAEYASYQLLDDHKRCAEALKGFVGICLKEFNFYSKAENQDSEAEGINFLKMMDDERDFHKDFVEFLSPNAAEGYIIKSYSLMTSASESLMLLDLESNPKRNLRLAESAVSNFRLAKETIDECLQNEDCLDGIIDEYLIMVSQNTAYLKDNAHYEFCKKNVEYMGVWREFYSLNEQFYKDVFIEPLDIDDSEYDLVNHENVQYLAKLNSLAIDICKTSLILMGYEVENFEIYSNKLIIDPISHLHQ